MQPRHVPKPQAIVRSVETWTVGLSASRSGWRTCFSDRYIGSGPQAKIWSAQRTKDGTNSVTNPWCPRRRGQRTRSARRREGEQGTEGGWGGRERRGKERGGGRGEPKDGGWGRGIARGGPGRAAVATAGGKVNVNQNTTVPNSSLVS